MASSLPSSLYALRGLRSSRRIRVVLPRPRAQHSGDEGKSSTSMVDANMGVLRKRMEMERTRERLQRQFMSSSHGWYYVSEYDPKLRRDAMLSESLEVAELFFGIAGLAIVSCTLCLCFVAFVAHLG